MTDRSFAVKEPAAQAPPAARPARAGVPHVASAAERRAQFRDSVAAARPNRTGLPDALKAGIESLSGFGMDEVRVHRNSPRPAQLRALAFAQGSDIHLAPGQERHLPHEAWHVVQQKQGRVKATAQLKGTALNDDPALEREADAMGALAARAAAPARAAVRREGESGPAVAQRITVAYTDADLGHPPPVAPGFADETVQQVVHARAAIPHAVRLAVDAFGDSGPPPVTYKHHVAYQTTLNRLINLCEGSTRGDIADDMGIRCDFVGADSDGFGLDPLANVASFNTWLDLAIVAVCDWPNNIYRGPSTGGDPDNPTAPTVALTNRLADARDVLGDIG